MSGKEFNILIVCTGNTCRSPMAEGILKHLLKSKDIDNIAVSSAGTAGLENYPATENAVEAAKIWDIDISGHRSRGVNRQIVDSADLILGMSTNHVDYVLNLSPEAKNKTYLFKGFPQPYSPAQESVRDPIGGSLELYNQTYLELDETIRRVERQIIDMSDSVGE